MSEENIAVVRRFWGGFNAHNLDVWDEVCTPNFVNHDPSLPTAHADLQTLKQIIGGMLTAFPDMSSTEDDLIDSGDKVVVRKTFRGTQRGEFMGVAPTNNQVEFTGMSISRLAGGKIEEHWVNFDALGLLQQIGAVPSK